jgi:hypothetical protein
MDVGSRFGRRNFGKVSRVLTQRWTGERFTECHVLLEVLLGADQVRGVLRDTRCPFTAVVLDPASDLVSCIEVARESNHKVVQWVFHPKALRRSLALVGLINTRLLVLK